MTDHTDPRTFGLSANANDLLTEKQQELRTLRTRLAEAESLLEEWLKETAEIQLPEMAELCAQHTHAFLKE